MCTPVGLSRMFTVMGQLLVKPTVSNHLDEVFTAFLKVESMEKSLLNSCCSDFFKKMSLQTDSSLLFLSERCLI